MNPPTRRVPTPVLLKLPCSALVCGDSEVCFNSHGLVLTVLASGEVVDSEPTGDDSPGTVPDGAHLLRTGPEVTSVACTTRVGHTGAMHRIRLTYFDLPGRGEVARLAMFLGGIDFEDRRVTFAEWPTVKPETPFGGIPVLEVDGEEVAQSNGINRFVGKLAGLYPTDPWQAALCDEAMDAVEDIGTQIVATFGIRGKEKLKAKRQSLADGPISFYLARLQRRLKARGGQYFADNRLTIADLKVFTWVGHLRSGNLDYVPKELPDRIAPLLVEHDERVKSHPKIQAYYEARRVESP